MYETGKRRGMENPGGEGVCGLGQEEGFRHAYVFQAIHSNSIKDFENPGTL